MMFIAAKSTTGCTFETVIPLDVPDGVRSVFSAPYSFVAAFVTSPPPVASLIIETFYQTSGKLSNPLGIVRIT